jgi:hypothetical protein
MVDELGDLEKWAATLGADNESPEMKAKRIETLRKAIRENYDLAPAAEAQTADGARYIALLGPMASKGTVNVPLLAKLIGSKACLAIATCTQEALKAFPGKAALVTTRALTGARSLNTFEKGSS